MDGIGSIYLAIVGAFNVLIGLEYGISKLRTKTQGYYSAADAWANIAMYWGFVAIYSLWFGVVWQLYQWLYSHRLTEAPAAILGESPLSIGAGAGDGWLLFGAMVGLLVLAEDFSFYWFHRLSHRLRFFWASHVNHHSSNQFNLTVAIRQTWTPFSAVLFWLWLPLVGFPPLWVIVVQAGSLYYQSILHTRLVPSYGPLGWFVNDPSHHRVHHGVNPIYMDKNFGGLLIIWDRMFGTFQREERNEPVRFGIHPSLNNHSPPVIAFHEWFAMVADWTTWLKNKLGISAQGSRSMGKPAYALSREPSHELFQESSREPSHEPTHEEPPLARSFVTARDFPAVVNNPAVLMGWAFLLGFLALFGPGVGQWESTVLAPVVAGTVLVAGLKLGSLVSRPKGLRSKWSPVLTLSFLVATPGLVYESFRNKNSTAHNKNSPNSGTLPQPLSGKRSLWPLLPAACFFAVGLGAYFALPFLPLSWYAHTLPPAPWVDWPAWWATLQIPGFWYLHVFKCLALGGMMVGGLRLWVILSRYFDLAGPLRLPFRLTSGPGSVWNFINPYFQSWIVWLGQGLGLAKGRTAMIFMGFGLSALLLEAFLFWSIVDRSFYRPGLAAAFFVAQFPFVAGGNALRLKTAHLARRPGGQVMRQILGALLTLFYLVFLGFSSTVFFRAWDGLFGG